MTNTLQQLRTDVDRLRDDLNTEKELRESAMQAQTTMMREESLGVKFELSKQLKNNTESVESVRLPAGHCAHRKRNCTDCWEGGGRRRDTPPHE
jgi:hypothetical protein